MSPVFARDRYWLNTSLKRSVGPKRWQERRQRNHQAYNTHQGAQFVASPATDFEQSLTAPSIHRAAPFAHQASLVDAHCSGSVHRRNDNRRWVMAQTFSSLHREREYLLSVLQNTNAKAAKLVNLLTQAERKLEYYIVQSQSISCNKPDQRHPTPCSTDLALVDNTNPTRGFAKGITHQKKQCKRFRGLLKRIEAQEKAILNNLGRVTWSIQAKERWIAASEAQMVQLSPRLPEQIWGNIQNGDVKIPGYGWQDHVQFQQEWPPQFHEPESDSSLQAAEGLNDFAIRSSLSEMWGERTNDFNGHSTYPQNDSAENLPSRQPHHADKDFASIQTHQPRSQSHTGIPLLVSQTDRSKLDPDDLAASVALYFPFVMPLEPQSSPNIKTQSNINSDQLPAPAVADSNRRASEVNRVVDYWPKKSTRNRSRTRSLPATLIEDLSTSDEDSKGSQGDYLGYGIINGGLGCVHEE